MYRDPEDHYPNSETRKLDEERSRREAMGFALAEQQRQAERDAAAKRLKLRDLPPPNYIPPGSAEELAQRYQKGERHFANARLHGAVLRDLKFENASFAAADLSTANFTDCQFEHCILDGTNANESTFEKTIFHRCGVDKLTLWQSTLTGTVFKAMNLTEIDFTACKFEELNFNACGNLPASFATARNPGAARFVQCTLTGAVLRDANLKGITFLECELNSADFTGTNLTDSDLSLSHLTNAKLELAQLKGAKLDGTVFAGSTLKLASNLAEITWKGADISNCDLSNSKLVKADFSEVEARNTDFSRCDLQDAKFSRACVNTSVFKNANLQKSKWESASITSADFEGANLRFVEEIWFDQNNLYTAKLSPKGGDAWTELRRQYSGSRLAFHMLILVAFFLPYVIRAAAWVQVNNAEAAHAAAIAELQSDPKMHRFLEEATIASPRFVQMSTSKCLAPKCREWRVWELLLARDAVWYSQLLAWLLIIYNLARLYLTWKVGPLRDDEDRTYVTPALSDYRTLFVAHKVVRVVFFVSLVSFAFHAYKVLILGSVWLPI
jgi:uncharacterized protein YjbI with pentapeptide repeats